MYAIRSYYASFSANFLPNNQDFVPNPDSVVTRAEELEKFPDAHHVITSYSIHYTKLYDCMYNRNSVKYPNGKTYYFEKNKIKISGRYSRSSSLRSLSAFETCASTVFSEIPNSAA